MTQGKRILVAMSGGVDSSVAVHLLQSQGYSCTGAMMLLHSKDADTSDAQRVAEKLGIPFHVLDATALFQRQVQERFVQVYESGGTPNPCVDCNRHLKFGYFLQTALDMGCECIATGHYARVVQDPTTGRYMLKKALNSAKDQSYFLACLNQQQLAHVRFPLGSLTKEAVRQIAEEQGLANAHKKDSQDICFVPDGDYLAFLERYTGESAQSGDFLDQSGKVVGRHRGAVGYTCGQRKGLGLAMGTPVYVCSKDMAANTVTIGPNEALFHRNLMACDWNWMAIEAPVSPIRCKAKVRSRMTEQDATVYPAENGEYRVCFDAPQRAITTGQAVVLYDGDLLLGGGTITAVCPREDDQ